MRRKIYKILMYIPKPSSQYGIKDINKAGTRVEYTNKPVPPPPPQPNKNSLDKDKIKRIENYLKQLEYEKYLNKSLGVEDINIKGKIIGLKIALSILKDEK